ncbi:MAG TPA: hypothetical protein VIZ68_08175 [Thermoplasmata archaeon]
MPVFRARVESLQQSGVLLRVRVGVGVAAEAAIRRAGREPPEPAEVEAMVDIGAGRSLIRAGLARRLGLTPVGRVEIDTPSSTNLDAAEYEVRFWLSHEFAVESDALEARLPGHDLGALLGRDVLAGAKLEYDGPRDEFSLTFEVPPGPRTR